MAATDPLGNQGFWSNGTPFEYVKGAVVNDGQAYWSNGLPGEGLFPTAGGSASASPSLSPSVSVSLSPSVSPSVSTSLSPSVSISLSPSLSPSPSASPSVSPSVSESLSPSVSVSLSQSLSPSVSISLSPSVSPSVSISLSPSVSPSEGYQGYTRGDVAVLPGDDTDLETTYSAQDLIDVASSDDVRVTQTATLEYAIHQYKDFASTRNNCFIEWEGQTSLSPGTSIVYLEIYNHNTSTWEVLDSQTVTYNSTREEYSDDTTYYNAPAVDTDFVLHASISDLTNYKDGGGVISCRVYQLEV